MASKPPLPPKEGQGSPQEPGKWKKDAGTQFYFTEIETGQFQTVLINTFPNGPGNYTYATGSVLGNYPPTKVDEAMKQAAKFACNPVVVQPVPPMPPVIVQPMPPMPPFVNPSFHHQQQ